MVQGNAPTDLAVQRDAARLAATGSLHCDAMRTDPGRELGGRHAAEKTFGLAPVKRHAIVRATGTALDARIGHGSRVNLEPKRRAVYIGTAPGRCVSE